MKEALAFFAPDLQVEVFPAWDCLPYDRISPHRDLVAQRLATLARLGKKSSKPRVVLTTINGLLQRLPPRSAIAGRNLIARPGDEVPGDRLTSFFSDNGYQRVDTVGEPGEFAFRGGILDVFPTGFTQPLRLDFFGDDLESIRTFDPLTQITTGKARELVLLPVSEVFLDEESIEKFRRGYRAAFGAVTGEDPLYESISEGRPHPGMEHWLPLFYDDLDTLLDYLPGAQVILDHQVPEAQAARLDVIQDFYEARTTMKEVEAAGGTVYQALPPTDLYLSEDDVSAALSGRAHGLFSPFNAPEELGQVLDAEGRHGRDFADARAASEGQLYETVLDYIRYENREGRQVLITGYTDGSRDRLAHLLKEHGAQRLETVENWGQVEKLQTRDVGLVTLGLERGFGSGNLTVITEQDILGERISRAPAKRKRPENFLTEVSTLEAGDHVVHIDHGIGRYEGLETLDVNGAPHDCLRVIYKGGDKLFVPVENIDLLSRFGGNDAVELDRLGQGNWQARKAKVKERIKDAADQLIRVAAARELRKTDPIQAGEGLYDEFAARFPYPETDDQLRSIADVLEDLGSGKPMDRLVCGDVGFGKTEVALRAAFVVAMSGKQVAVVVPTTLLARQHYRNFKERFAGLPVRIGQLSRLVTTKEANQNKKDLKDGQLDIVVGTHAMLGSSIGFKDLGLLIVDEEQHFGVKQKERLKALRAEVHVLTLTATPIPRTLQLAMSGVKEMSLIATPPVDRLAVRTFVLPYDPVVVREAILREHYRGGQTYYVCPRLEDLASLEERLKKLVPEVKVAVAHGQLPPTRLEEVMSAFVDHKFDVLLSTNIVESGLDIPSANTLIIHRADMFGLAQLYQLRGRVGRSKQRAYAYFTLRPGKVLSKTAEKRLHVMQTLDTLGAGFTLASHDMDIRGAGNLLGEEQSGHIREVGIELYQQLLEEAVAAARADGVDGLGANGEKELWSPQINLGTSVLIPESYVTDLSLRLGLYRRLSNMEDRSEIDAFAAELVDRFGPLPEEVNNLLEIMTIKRLCREAGVEKLDAGPRGAVVTFRNDAFANPTGLIGFVQSQVGKVKLRPDHKLVYTRGWDDSKQRLLGSRRLLEGLAKIARKAP
ncbi:transcription-repair coupling factor [Rhodovibrionaceae bacterium A322]